jgi:hypothetical protein
MIRLKESTRLHDLCPQIVLALVIAEQVYVKHGLQMTVTSGSDGVHSETSLHYDGRAVDLRCRILTPDNDEDATVTRRNRVARSREKQAIRDEIKEALTRDFDVVAEANHIHIEYQPRRP